MTADTPRDPFDDGLVWKDHLPLAWTALAGLPGEAERARVDVANEALLKSLSAFDDAPRIAEDSVDAVQQELLRLDLKLNLLLQIVGEALVAQRPLPEAVDLRLTALGAEWAGAGAADVWLELELFLAPSLPRPLVLFARVLPAPAPGLTRVVFEGMGEAVQAAFEKYLFRLHRRAVARRRAHRDA